MKRVLFVDDEPKLLDGLRRMLRPQRNEWDMYFSPGADAALHLMRETPIDVVVTDMRMPGMDGARLLERVHESFPGVMRIVLSGHFDVEAGMRAVPVAHQFLTKPCDPQKLRAAIDTASRMTAAVPDDATRRLVTAIGGLPSLPQTAADLNAALRDPHSSTEAIATIVSRDVGISAKVLQLVNSAFFSLPSEIADLKMAVACIGLDVLKQLALSAEILRVFHPLQPIAGFSLGLFERHAQLTAKIACHIANDLLGTPPGAPAPLAPAGLATVSGLLHDTGKLILAQRLPARFERALRRSANDGLPLYVCEDEEFGATHAEIGAYLLNLWGLPSPLVDAVAAHHRPPSRAEGSPPELGAILHIANALAHECTLPGGLDLPVAPAGVSLDYLHALGATVGLPGWRAAARGFAGQPLGGR
jgi:HD-like signal output (HDOD) protein